MWRKLITDVAGDDDIVFGDPAGEEALAGVEFALKVKLPDDLRSLLAEADGVEGEYGLGLVWPLERIERDNLGFRSNADFKELYMPFDHLLFFGDAGNGDQFAYPILGGKIRRPDIFVWNQEEDSRQWLAASLYKYLVGWLDGSLTV